MKQFKSPEKKSPEPRTKQSTEIKSEKYEFTRVAEKIKQVGVTKKGGREESEQRGVCFF